MELNVELNSEQLKQELRKAGLNPNGCMMSDFRRSLSFEQEKLYQKCKDNAEKRTKELQNLFPATLGIDRRQLTADFIANVRSCQN